MATKIEQIDQRIEMLSEVLNYAFNNTKVCTNITGQVVPSVFDRFNSTACPYGYSLQLSKKTTEAREKYTAQLKSYTTSYGTATKFKDRNRNDVPNLYMAAYYTNPFMYSSSMQAELNHLIQERSNQEKFIQDQKILQENALTEQANAKARQEEERIKLLQEQLKADINKTEQEKWKIQQEMEKARLELEKAKLAATLAKQGGEGNVAAGKTLLGTWEKKEGVNPWMIAGISVGAVAIGALVFKILK